MTSATDTEFSHVADLAYIRDRLELPPCVLLGCSQGGRIAVDFALAFPGSVTALVLISTALSGAPAPVFPGDLQAVMTALEEAEAAGDIEAVNSIEARLWLDGPWCTGPRITGRRRDLFLDMNRIVLMHPPLTQEVQPPDATARIADLKMPVLLISGNLDFPHVRQRHRDLAQTLPDARSVELNGCAHLAGFEAPGQVNACIREFLAEPVM